MLELVLGAKGNGKTKYLLASANESGLNSDGVVVYLDKNNKHIFELNKHVRLINVREYPVPSFDVLLGFVCGIVSGNSDIEKIYFDSFLTLASLTDKDNAEDYLEKMLILSEFMKVKFVVSLSYDESFLPEKYKSMIVHSI